MVGRVTPTTNFFASCVNYIPRLVRMHNDVVFTEMGQLTNQHRLITFKYVVLHEALTVRSSLKLLI